MKNGYIGGLGLVVVIGVASALVITTAHKQPGREIVMSTEMDYCRSDANTSPDKEAQLQFLRKNHLAVTGSNTSINITVGDPNGDAIYVRYFMGDHPEFAPYRCKFGLATPANHPEVGLRMAKYVRDGQPFDPMDGFCLSTVPPQINADRTVATLRCDKVLP